MTKRFSKFKLLNNSKVDLWGGLHYLKRVDTRKEKLLGLKKVRASKHLLFKYILKGRKKKKAYSYNFFNISFSRGKIAVRRGGFSSYKKRFNLKQNLKKFYSNIKNYQFRKIFLKAVKSKFLDEKKNNLLKLLESRLDNVLYRSHIGITVHLCRQFINHRNVFVNSCLVNKPSHLIQIGDIISFKNTKILKNKIYKNMLKYTRFFSPVPSYLNINLKNLKIQMIAKPQVFNVFFPFPINLNKILYFYKNKR